MYEGLAILWKNNIKPKLAAFNVVLCILVIFIHVSSTTVTAQQKDFMAICRCVLPLAAFCICGVGIYPFERVEAILNHIRFVSFWA